MKKRFLPLFLALALCLGLCAVPAFAADGAPKPIATVKADSIVSNGKTDALIVEYNGKYGVYDYDGTEILAPTYTYAKSYSDGMAAVTMEGSMKVLDEMYEIEEFEDGKYGYINVDGELVIPMQYAAAFEFHDDRAFVRETADGPLLMIDYSGKVIASYDNVDLWYYETVQFSEGLAVIPIRNDGWGSDLTYLVVDTSGKTVYTQEGGYLDFVDGYQNGLVASAESCDWGTGGPLLERSAHSMSGTGYRDATGAKVISGDYVHVYAFNDGLAPVAFSVPESGYDYKYGYIDTTGSLVVPAVYDSVMLSGSGGVRGVSNDGLWGFVDQSGKELTGLVYEDIWNFYAGYGAGYRNNSLEILDAAGKVMYTAKDCDGFWGFYNEVTAIGSSATGIYRVYDKDFNDVTPTIFNKALTSGSGHIWLGINGTYSVYIAADLVGTTPIPTFTDVPDWCAAAVSWAVGNSVTTGTTANKFSPSTQCSQAMILTFLWRAAGEPASSAALPVDITGKNIAYAETALRWAAEKGMVGPTLDPTAACTRADAVTYIWKAFGSQSAAASSFGDVPASASYAAAVNWAVANGIVEGYTDGNFHPETACNRGVIVTMLHRAYVESARLNAN